MTSTSCRLEPAIWSRDTGQQIPCLDRCQLLITWMFNIKEVHGKPRLHLSTNLLLGVWPPCCATPPSPAVVRTRPRAIPLPMTTMRKSVHGFHFPYMAMGLRLAALRAAGAPLLRGCGFLLVVSMRESSTVVKLFLEKVAAGKRSKYNLTTDKNIQTLVCYDCLEVTLCSLRNNSQAGKPLKPHLLFFLRAAAQ